MKQNQLHIPTREQFHKEYAGELTKYDFCTLAPNKDRVIPFTRKELEMRENYINNNKRKI